MHDHAHAGSCHCGQIAFEVDGEFPSAPVCNCSYCRRAGHMLAWFCLKTAQKDVSTYLFNKQAISHYFCATCVIATHGGGIGPDGKRMVAVNLRCVTDVDLETLKIDKFDGAKL